MPRLCARPGASVAATADRLTPTRYRHSGRRAAERLGDPEPSGAEGDLFRQGVRDSFALSRAAGFRVSAAPRPE